MKARLKQLVSKNKLIYYLVSRLYYLLCKEIFYYLFRIFPIKSNKIVFSNFYGNGYGQNPKYIAEEILRQGLSYDLVWLLRKELMGNSHLPQQIRPVRFGSLQSIYEMVTAGVWIDDVRQPDYIKKRKGQQYIQTFHGGPSLKRVENDVAEKLGARYIKDAVADSKKTDVFLSNGSWYTDLVRNSFWYSGEILESGFPRNDIFFDQCWEMKRRVRDYFGISGHTRIVLYAPTFRSDPNYSGYDVNTETCLAALSERFSGEWIFMVRLHPAIRSRSNLFAGSPTCIDATDYEDVQELLSAVDSVITDYSGLMFDCAIRRLPVFLHAPDVNQYTQERNFYFTWDELPFTLAESNDMLSHHIRTFDLNRYLEHVNSFLQHVGSCDDGMASAAVVNRIRSLIERGSSASMTQTKVGLTA